MVVYASGGYRSPAGCRFSVLLCSQVLQARTGQEEARAKLVQGLLCAFVTIAMCTRQDHRYHHGCRWNVHLAIDDDEPVDDVPVFSAAASRIDFIDLGHTDQPTHPAHCTIH
jgi:hypothetical protein